MILVLMGAGVFLALFLLKKIYENIWDRNLDATVELSEHRVYPGDTVILTETVTNGKWLPLPMIKVKFEVDKSMVFHDFVENTNISDKCYKSDVFSVLFFQKITRRIPFRCTKRGYFTINSMDVVSTDVMMDSVLAATYEVNEKLLVYPERIDTDWIDTPYNSIMGDILTKRYTNEDPFEFKGVRDYQTYDTMNMINWKASAKTGELKVNVHGNTAGTKICLLLNLENEGILSYENLKEKSISLAACLAARFMEQGIATMIMSNGRDKITKENLNISYGCDDSHTDTIALGLARIDLKLEMGDFTEYVSRVKSTFTENDYLVLISHSRRESLQKEMTDIALEGKKVIWIFPTMRGSDRNFEFLNGVQVLTLEVAGHE